MITHIYGCQALYKSGVMTSRSNIRGETLGGQFSKIPVEELQAAADKNDPQTSTMVNTLMKSIFTSCKALGHTRSCTIWKAVLFFHARFVWTE